MARRVATVFGGSGFIGRYLVRRLAKQDYVVRIACRSPHEAEFLRVTGNPGQIYPIAADVGDKASVSRAVHGADVVVNLVGILFQSGRRQRFDRLHAVGAKNIAEACAEEGVKRLVHISAIGANPDAKAHYARSKGVGEENVRKAFPKATILRPSIVFGPEDGFFNMFANLARFSPVLPVPGTPLFPRVRWFKDGLVNIDWFGRGGPRMQPVYVIDLAEAITTALHDKKTEGAVYEVGGPHVYSFKELMELVLAYTQRKRLLVPVPYPFMWLQGLFMELLPKPLVTRDQARMLKIDNVVGPRAKTLKDLGVQPHTVESVVPRYLARYAKNARGSVALG